MNNQKELNLTSVCHNGKAEQIELKIGDTVSICKADTGEHIVKVLTQLHIDQLLSCHNCFSGKIGLAW